MNNHQVICKTCGERFSPTGNGSKFCKPECRASSVAREKQKIKHTPCVICGDPCRGEACSKCWPKLTQRKQKAQRESANLKVDQVCKCCKSVFRSKKIKKYCSDKCLVLENRRMCTAWNKKRAKEDPEFARKEKERRIKQEAGWSEEYKLQRMEKSREWKRNHLELGRAQRSIRRADLRKARHKNHVREIERTLHKLARRREEILGNKWHVDHVVPLNSGGWHHHQNLQVIPARWNSQKQDNPYWRPGVEAAWFRSPTMEDILNGKNEN